MTWVSRWARCTSWASRSLEMMAKGPFVKMPIAYHFVYKTSPLKMPPSLGIGLLATALHPWPEAYTMPETSLSLEQVSASFWIIPYRSCTMHSYMLLMDSKNTLLIVVQCRNLIQFISEYFFEGHKRNPKPLRVWVSNTIKLFFSHVLMCFYGQNMLVCHVFLGDPPLEKVSHLYACWISRRKYSATWVPGWQLLTAQLMQMGVGSVPAPCQPPWTGHGDRL